MVRFAELFRQHPDYFELNEVTAVTHEASNSERIQETIFASYAQGEIKLMNNRLFLIGGVRFERTHGCPVKGLSGFCKYLE